MELQVAAARLCSAMDAISEFEQSDLLPAAKAEQQRLRVVLLEEMQRAGVRCIETSRFDARGRPVFACTGMYSSARAVGRDVVARAVSETDLTLEPPAIAESFIQILRGLCTQRKAYARIAHAAPRGQDCHREADLSAVGREVVGELVLAKQRIEDIGDSTAEARAGLAADKAAAERVLLRASALREQPLSIGRRVVQVKTSVRKKPVTIRVASDVARRVFGALPAQADRAEIAGAYWRELVAERGRSAQRADVVRVTARQ